MALVRRRRALRTPVTFFTALVLVLTAFASLAPAPARAATSSITINKHVCYGQVNGNIYDMAAACEGADQVYTYNLYFGVGGPIATSNTSGSLAGFSGLDVGTYYVEEVPSPNFDSALVWCKVDDFAGQPVQELFASEDFNWQIEVNIATDGNMVYCDWFNYSNNAPAATGGVLVNKIVCPADYEDAYTADIYGIAANCHETPPATNLTLTDANGVSSTMTTATSPPYQAEWTEVPYGDLSISEEIPSGYGTPRVFCKNENLTSDGDAEEEVPVSGNSITFTFKPGYDVIWCDWVNIPLEGVTIYINKHLCPDGYRSDDIYELAANCHEQYDPYGFDVNGNLIGPGGSQQTGEVVEGGVQFSGLPADTWTVVEDLPEGYGEPVVFCKFIKHSDGSETSQDRAEILNGNTVSYPIDAGYTLWCDWFNVTDTPYVGIYIHKYGCDADYDRNWSYEEWLHGCTKTVQGASFTLNGPDDYSSELPVSGSDVTWEQLAPGDYSVKERLPTSYTGGVLYCAVGSFNGDAGEYTKFELSDNGFSYELDDYEYLDCYWFNLPPTGNGPSGPGTTPTPRPTGPATLTIIKYTCPAEYDPLASGANPTSDCDELTDDVTFSVVSGQGSTVNGETGDEDPGTVTFSNLKAGSYLIRETYPDDVAEAFIWSCESSVRAFDYPFTPFARIGATGTIKISLVAGENMSCDWFNVPSPTGAAGGDVPVKFSVYECPNQTVNSAACDPVDGGTEIRLESLDSGETTTLETDDDGIATGSVESGEYDLDADMTICFGESTAATPDGTLLLEGTEEISATIYLCSD